MKIPSPPAWLAAAVLRRRFAAILRDQAAPLVAQERALERLRAALRDTSIARATGLVGATDLASFARSVPVHEYDFYSAFVERVLDRGERSVLFGGAPAFVGLSSGTTGMNTKRIVHNHATIAAYRHFETGLAAIIERHSGVNPVVGDRLLVGATIPSTTRTPFGVEQGYISGYLATNARWIVRDRSVPSAAVGRIPDMRQKMLETGREVRGRDLRMASAVPSYLVNLLEGLRTEWGVPDFSQIWPRLDVVIYSGTAIEAYRDQLRALLGHPLVFIGMYVATEGPIGYEIPSLDGARAGLYAFHYGSLVYTFRKLDGDGRVLTVGDLKAGDDVELLLSAPNGLINYRLGDCLKIHSTAPLLFEIAGRIGQGLNVAAEKVSLSQLARAVARVSRDTAPIAHFFVCPGRSGEGRPRYDWTVLVDAPEAADRGALAVALDRALGDESGDYKETRELSFLDAPSVRVLHSSIARRYFERDAHRGQLKMKTAFDASEKLEDFLRALGVAPDSAPPSAVRGRAADQ